MKTELGPVALVHLQNIAIHLDHTGNGGGAELIRQFVRDFGPRLGCDSYPPVHAVPGVVCDRVRGHCGKHHRGNVDGTWEMFWGEDDH